MNEGDFNNIKDWLKEKLAERQMSTNMFVLKTGNRVTNATLFRWYNDTFRPNKNNPDKLQIVCETLSQLPILEEGRPPRFEEVPLKEALAQYTEKPRADRLRRR